MKMKEHLKNIKIMLEIINVNKINNLLYFKMTFIVISLFSFPFREFMSEIFTIIYNNIINLLFLIGIIYILPIITNTKYIMLLVFLSIEPSSSLAYCVYCTPRETGYIAIVVINDSFLITFSHCVSAH